MRARLAISCLVLAVPLLIAVDGDGEPEHEVAAEAIKYVNGFRTLIARDSSEAARLGLEAGDLDTLTATATLQVADADPLFRTAADRRSLDQSLVLTDLWWVLLESDNGSHIVVSVRWPDGAKTPEGIGLNWAPAAEFADALVALNDPSPQLVWIPEDAPVLIGVTPGGGQVAVPIANETMAARLRMETGPMPVAAYTTEVRDRLSRLAAVPGIPKTGDGGGAGHEVEPQGLSGVLAMLMAPLALLIMILVLSARSRGLAANRRQRGIR